MFDSNVLSQDIALTDKSSLVNLCAFKPGIYYFCGHSSTVTYGIDASAPGVFTLISRIMNNKSVLCTILDLNSKPKNNNLEFPYIDLENNTVLGQIYIVKSPNKDVLELLRSREEHLRAPVIVFSYDMLNVQEGVHTIMLQAPS